jgi:hypothetical protein
LRDAGMRPWCLAFLPPGSEDATVIKIGLPGNVDGSIEPGGAQAQPLQRFQPAYERFIWFFLRGVEMAAPTQ